MTGNIGTVHWTAPEVLNNERYHFAADIYSLGMVMVEMVSGTRVGGEVGLGEAGLCTGGKLRTSVVCEGKWLQSEKECH